MVALKAMADQDCVTPIEGRHLSVRDMTEVCGKGERVAVEFAINACRTSYTLGIRVNRETNCCTGD